MSLKDDIIQHKSRLSVLETELVGLELRAAKLGDDLRAQISTLTPVQRWSPEAINFANLKLCRELVKIRANLEESEKIRTELEGLGS
jgi:hypothetical protein